MYKPLLFITLIGASLILTGCTDNRFMPPIDATTGIPLPPPPELGVGRGPEFDKMMKKRIDEACLSGIMQTGSVFFQELTKNAETKMEKLLFIKTKLESIKSNASKESREQIIEQLKVINEMIEEIEERDAEFKQDPNIICSKTKEMKQMNKKMKEKILDLSSDMKIIREHEKNEGVLQHMKEKIFGEDPSEDFSDQKENESKKRDTENKKRDTENKKRDTENKTDTKED